MANIESQKKRNRQSEVARLRNKAVRSEVKTKTRDAREATKTGNTDAIKTKAVEAQRALAVAGRKGVLHKNQVARRQSRMAKLVNNATST